MNSYTKHCLTYGCINDKVLFGVKGISRPTFFVLNSAEQEIDPDCLLAG